MLGDRDNVSPEKGESLKKGTVIGKLLSELGPRYLDRPGGYTRIIHLSLRRLGDNGQLVLLQLVGKDETLTKKRPAAPEAAPDAAPAELPAEADEAVEAVEVEEDTETTETHDTEGTEDSAGKQQ